MEISVVLNINKITLTFIATLIPMIVYSQSQTNRNIYIQVMFCSKNMNNYLFSRLETVKMRGNSLTILINHSERKNYNIEPGDQIEFAILKITKKSKQKSDSNLKEGVK